MLYLSFNPWFTWKHMLLFCKCGKLRLYWLDQAAKYAPQIQVSHRNTILYLMLQFEWSLPKSIQGVITIRGQSLWLLAFQETWIPEKEHPGVSGFVQIDRNWDCYPFSTPLPTSNSRKTLKTQSPRVAGSTNFLGLRGQGKCDLRGVRCPGLLPGAQWEQ